MSDAARSEDRVRTLLAEVVQEPDVEVDEDLIERGLLDSLAVVELLTLIEREFDIAIPFDDLELDDLRTPARIVALVNRWIAGEVPHSS